MKETILNIQQLRGIIPVFFIESELDGSCVLINSDFDSEEKLAPKDYISLKFIKTYGEYPDLSHSESKIFA